MKPFRRARRTAAADAYRSSAPPSSDTPWREAAYAVVDLETTGLDARHDEIISFASIPIDAGRIVVGGSYTTIIRPRTMPPPETIRIHGLRRTDLEGAPTLAETLERILDALHERVLVAHVARVEKTFLAAALKTARVRLRGPVLDTAVLAKRALGAAAPPKHVQAEARSRDEPGLSRAARRFGLPVHRPHHAEGDALTTAQLFIALATLLEEGSPQTVGSLARLSRSG